MHAALRAEGLLAPSSARFSVDKRCRLCNGLGSLLSYPLLVATLCFNPAEGPQTASRSAECRGRARATQHVHRRWIYAYMAGHRTSTSLWLSDSYSCEFGFVCQWWLLSLSFQCGYVAFDLFFPFPKSNSRSASQYANDDWQRPPSIVDLTAREQCRIFTFAKHVSFEHSIGIPCAVISSGREGNIKKQTKPKSFLTLDRRSVSPHRPACVRALRGQWAIWRRLAPRLPQQQKVPVPSLHPARCRKLLAMQSRRNVERGSDFDMNILCGTFEELSYNREEIFTS